MESSRSSIIESRAEEIKAEMFRDFDPYSFVSSSAYDTAWLAMIPADSHIQPMFKNCFEWLLNNQKQQGFWGHTDASGKPTIDSLPATLASMIALKMWNTGASIIQKGKEFIEANAEQLVKDVKDHCPRWVAIILPSMIELADTIGLNIVFPETVRSTVSCIFTHHQIIFDKEELVGNHYPPLLSYLEALPASYVVNEEDMLRNLSVDGSLFQSPSATAKAFLATGNEKCLSFLQSLVQRCPNGVPQTYPMDEDLLRLCMVNQLERLGLAEHFVNEIEQILAQVYRNYLVQESWVNPSNTVGAQLDKDCLAFQLLRMHGYKVSPSLSFCFLGNQEIRDQAENNLEYFSTTLLSTYRASNLMFCGEHEVEEAKSFSRKLLEKVVAVRNDAVQSHVEYELNVPWLARLDHLEHRMWIEEKEANALWQGKASSNRISCQYNQQLLQLAKQNYEFRQSIYKTELEELKRWCQKWGLSNMGFGREKSTYCYFAIAAATALPQDSYVRTLVAKSGILITIADDFFDLEGPLSELESLTDAIGRWDSTSLSGHSKVIFDALDDLVSEAATKCHQQERTEITNSLKNLWYETFRAWLVEAKWSKGGLIPSLDDYLEIGMTSIATHTMVLPASCFLKPSLPNQKLRPSEYEIITKLLLVTTRLLSDMQSYQKEKEEGKMNSVLVNLMENPEANIEDSIAYLREITEKKKKELLEHALIDGLSDLPKPCKQLHLSFLKVFQMFYSSSNLFDYDTPEILHDINKAIYLPVNLKIETPEDSFSAFLAKEEKSNTNELVFETKQIGEF